MVGPTARLDEDRRGAGDKHVEVGAGHLITVCSKSQTGPERIPPINMPNAKAPVVSVTLERLLTLLRSSWFSLCAFAKSMSNC